MSANDYSGSRPAAAARENPDDWVVDIKPYYEHRDDRHYARLYRYVPETDKLLEIQIGQSDVHPDCFWLEIYYGPARLDSVNWIDQGILTTQAAAERAMRAFAPPYPEKR